jgi:hypothetical protein
MVVGRAVGDGGDCWVFGEILLGSRQDAECDRLDACSPHLPVLLIFLLLVALFFLLSARVWGFGLWGLNWRIRLFWLPIRVGIGYSWPVRSTE